LPPLDCNILFVAQEFEMFAVTRQVYWLDTHSLEFVYVAIFMIGMTAAMLLGRWTTKRLLVFIFVVATLLMAAKAGRAVIDHSNAHTVQVPV
jgi:dolichyl-phosphate-mannose--protein O-mannosyl transferase